MASKDTRASLTIILENEEVYRALEHAAHVRGRSISGIVAEAFVAWQEKHDAQTEITRTLRAPAKRSETAVDGRQVAGMAIRQRRVPGGLSNFTPVWLLVILCALSTMLAVGIFRYPGTPPSILLPIVIQVALLSIIEFTKWAVPDYGFQQRYTPHHFFEQLVVLFTTCLTFSILITGLWIWHWFQASIASVLIYTAIPGVISLFGFAVLATTQAVSRRLYIEQVAALPVVDTLK